MKLVTAFLLAAALAAPGLTQDESEPAFSFPEELIILPEEIQAQALDGATAEEVDVPLGLAPADAAYFRAQVAFVTEDWIAARQFAETAAVAGNADAAVMAGFIARDGRATGEADALAAASWFRRAADQDHPTALYQLGLLARLRDSRLQLGEPRPFFERAARIGHVEAMLAYALDLKASPIPQDAVTARRWAERAALSGSVEAMFQFAQILDQGTGGPVDLQGAREWYEQAAAQRHAEAALQAGLMWAEGAGGFADDSRARTLLRQSAESGFAQAQGQYGLMLYQGRGGEADLEMAAYWFREGALGGDAESQFLYAFALARGEGVEQDLLEAYRWTLEGAIDALGQPVSDPTRDTLQARLEAYLPAADRLRIQSEVDAAR